jgi:outer membrane protein assembly factor BamB
LPVTAALLRPPREVGWQAAIGRVQRPVPARLRANQPPDLVAVNSDGTVYALEGQTGVPLWSARYRAQRQGGGAAAEAPAELFTPLLYAPKEGTAHVVAAFDGGLRMLEGETGRELWRASLTGRPVSGSVTAFSSDDAPEIAVVTADPSQLYVFNGTTGGLVSQTKLSAAVIGLPVPFQSGAERGVALSLEGGQLEIRKSDGSRLRGIRFDVPFTTPPLTITSPQGTLIVVGTEHGLLFLNGAKLEPLGRITTENDSPRGRLAAADLDGDLMLEVAMVTKRGRVVVISAAGKIDWAADGARDAYSAIFADLDRDGALDVLVADEGVFARGFSGRDGRLIWQVDDEPKSQPAGGDGDGKRPLRTLALAAGQGTAFVVSGDLSRGALRAVGLFGAPGRVAGK